MWNTCNGHSQLAMPGASNAESWKTGIKLDEIEFRIDEVTQKIEDNCRKILSLNVCQYMTFYFYFLIANL